MNKSSIRFAKGSKEQRHLRKQVMAFIALSNVGSLFRACEKTGHNYQIIYGQLNGYRICRVSDIEDFIQNIDKTRRIEIYSDGMPTIVKK